MIKNRRTPEEIKKLRDMSLKNIKKDFSVKPSKDNKKPKNQFGKGTFGKN